VKRLVPLLGVVLALAFASSAAADTFRVVRSPASSNAGQVAFGTSGSVVPFTETQSSAPGPMSFAALRGIWQAAGSTYGIPWEVLAAINKVESDFGRNLGPSSAGAVGWMQFMPSTWARWGIDANGDGVADPDNPTDAIFSAARYLAGCGGQFDIARAVYCYNHASWYVNEVMGLAAVYSRGGGSDFSSGATIFSSGARLGPQMTKMRGQIATSKTQVAAARAAAHKLERAERRFLRVAATAHLLSDQLQARKHAVLLGVRRSALDARIARLSKRLSFATAQLGRLREEASTGQLLSAPMYGGFAPAGQAGGVVSIAMRYLGIPYVFAQLGISLPHNTVAQWNSPDAVSVPRNQLQPGDLVFFAGLDHVGIYIGNGDYIDAPHTGAFVRIDSLKGAWERANYDGAKRIVAASLDTFAPSSGSTAFTSDVVYFTH
jgi:cell wall-associated NlpC family hydrolase